MNEPVFSIRLNDSQFRVAARQASRVGMSVEDWLGALALEYIAENLASHPFVPSPTQESDARMIREILDKAPDRPPDSGDELPEGYISSRVK